MKEYLRRDCEEQLEKATDDKEETTHIPATIMPINKAPILTEKSGII